MNKVPVKINVIREGCLPFYKHVTDACADCYANIPDNLGLIKLKPNELCTIPLGFKLELPDGWKAVIYPRSGFSKKGIAVSTGTIDEGYRGEVGCTIQNLSGKDFIIHDMDRICQIGFEPYYHAEFTIVDNVSDSDRGESGWGSTGVK